MGERYEQVRAEENAKAEARKAERKARAEERQAQYEARKAENKAKSEQRKAKSAARTAERSAPARAKFEERKATYEQSKAEAKEALGEAPSIKEAWTAAWAEPREQFKARRAEVNAKIEQPKIGRLFVASAMTFGAGINRKYETVTAGTETLPIAGTTVEFSAGNAHQRVTATRMALTGPLAFALKKSAGSSFLIFTAADGRQGATKVDPKRTSAAVQFVAEFNSVSARLAARDAAAVEE